MDQDYGRPSWTRRFCGQKVGGQDEHRVLFRRILARISSAHGFCCYFVPPLEPIQRFAAAHDEDMWCCLQELLGIEGTMRVRQLSNLPFALGGLGLRSAVRGRIAAYWASWADTLRRIRERHPRIADLIGASLFRNRFPEFGGCSALQRHASGCGFQCPRMGRCVRRASAGKSSREQGRPRNTVRLAVFSQRGGREDEPPERHLARALTIRSGPSEVPVWSFRWHSLHMLTSGARVAFGTSCVAFGAPSLLPVRPSPRRRQHVGGQGCWGVEGSRWRAQPPGSAGRQVGGSPSMCAWPILISSSISR